MRIGIDLDNTIVCYDELFVRLARVAGLLPSDVLPTKKAIRDHLRLTGQERQWTILQGLAYGQRMTDAVPFPGAEQFLRRCQERQIDWYIISHRSRVPYAGDPYDLHQAARNWLRDRGFTDHSNEHRVVLEATLVDKLRRITGLECSIFIDDLPEVLTDGEFPNGVRRILFDPANQNSDHPLYERATSWNEITRLTDL